MAMATLFKFEYRQGLLGHDKPGPSNDKPKGLLGGPEKARSVLVDATKQDDLLQKTLVPRFSTKSRSGHVRRRSRSRSRSQRSGQDKSSRPAPMGVVNLTSLGIHAGKVRVQHGSGNISCEDLCWMLLPPRAQLSFLAAIIERIAFIREPLWLRILRDRCCSEMVGLRLKFNPFPFFRFIDIDDLT